MDGYFAIRASSTFFLYSEEKAEEELSQLRSFILDILFYLREAAKW